MLWFCGLDVVIQNICFEGGLNPEAGPERGENFSNRELRRARMELIYKDYEVKTCKNTKLMPVLIYPLLSFCMCTSL